MFAVLAVTNSRKFAFDDGFWAYMANGLPVARSLTGNVLSRYAEAPLNRDGLVEASRRDLEEMPGTGVSVIRRTDASAMSTFDLKTLDTILALQLTIGWAGERAEDPKRLSWWNTDLTDAMAGGDLFARLLPRTAAWAGLELARRAGLQADRAARSKLAQPDQVWTLFHFGFELDEAIQDRLEYHKRHTENPRAAFEKIWGVRESWDRSALEGFLGALGKAPVEETPGGRLVKKLPAEPAAAAQSLAAALLPLVDTYPLPHGPIPGGEK